MAERRAALAGIRVIDLSHQAAGPRRAGGVGARAYKRTSDLARSVNLREKGGLKTLSAHDPDGVTRGA